MILIQDPNDSGDSGSDPESEDTANSVDDIQDHPNSIKVLPQTFYHKILYNYEDQSKSEPDHDR